MDNLFESLGKILKPEKHTSLPNNQILHEGIKYNVWVQEKENRQYAHIYKDGDKMPLFGTAFGNMASFKNDIMPWATKKITSQIKN